jgi:hypothetical protein
MLNLGENEKIIEIKRRHKIILFFELIPIFLFILFILISFFLLIFSRIYFSDWILESIPWLVSIRVTFFVSYILISSIFIGFLLSLIVFTNYYLDCWIITNERTVHTELKSLFNRTLSVVSHSRIQDITVNVNGVMPTILKYGNIQIQTAGKFNKFIFKQIPEPYKTKELIFKLKKEILKK